MISFEEVAQAVLDLTMRAVTAEQKVKELNAEVAELKQKAKELSDGNIR